MTWQMQLQLTVERPADDAAAARMLRAWFTGAFEAVGGKLRAAVLAAEPMSDYNLKGRPADEPYGNPGEVWSAIHTSARGARGVVRTKSKAYSTKAWKAFLEGLSAPPFGAELTAITLDHAGFPNAFPALTIGLRTNDDDPGWWFLSVRFGPELLDDPEFQKSALTFVRSFADDWNLAYGEISYDRGSGRTAFESVFRGQPDQTSRTSRQTLRGYAWLTICPQEVGDRLGGLPALRASGAFAQVEALSNGGYWLLATDDWRDFGQPVAERMFSVLAPALRPGEPLPDAPDDPPYYVSRRDAAEAQG
ncbi:hypothetical protein ACPCHT_37300 [Nucisporomicrobium flavum]|uniref:hypothetical protein n=1 Tax=Nucisporomicrobium flavum TaxID=2785915 RepID=UPI0018F6C5A3|nr:hypothetical protein [Nucisporomicrobium flavum]